MSTEEEYLSKGPSSLFVYHPALGPLYSVISQKIQKGKLFHGAELQLEIAEVHINNLRLEGSLLIHANHILGSVNPTTSHLEFSEKVGRCTLLNVQVKNEGIDRNKPNVFWKRDIHRKGSLEIILEGFSEFYAKDVTFSESMKIVVPPGMKATASMGQNGKVDIRLEKLETPSWSWKYAVEDDKILLKVMK